MEWGKRGKRGSEKGIYTPKNVFSEFFLQNVLKLFTAEGVANRVG